MILLPHAPHPTPDISPTGCCKGSECLGERSKGKEEQPGCVRSTAEEPRLGDCTQNVSTERPKAQGAIASLSRLRAWPRKEPATRVRLPADARGKGRSRGKQQPWARAARTWQEERSPYKARLRAAGKGWQEPCGAGSAACPVP